MVIDCISDLHNRLPDLQGGDLLLCGGDLTFYGSQEELTLVMEWFNQQSLQYADVVFIAGNHDIGLKKNPNPYLELLASNVHYLQDEEKVIQGLKIYGSPYSRTMGAWVFSETETDLGPIFAQIPEGLDILITHSPAHGVLDRFRGAHHVGSKALRERMDRMEQLPRLHLVGHIHEGYGVHEGDRGLKSVNAAMDGKQDPIALVWNRENQIIDIDN